MPHETHDYVPSKVTYRVCPRLSTVDDARRFMLRNNGQLPDFSAQTIVDGSVVSQVTAASGCQQPPPLDQDILRRSVTNTVCYGEEISEPIGTPSAAGAASDFV